jgi:hypothetical protein
MTYRRHIPDRDIFCFNSSKSAYLSRSVKILIHFGLMIQNIPDRENRLWKTFKPSRISGK